MIVAATGHRPPKLGGYRTPNPIYEAVKAGLRRRLLELRPTVVLSGMALGVDQWVAALCLEMGIPYDAIVPFHGFESRWPLESKRLFRVLCDRARSVHVVTPTSEYSPSLMQRRSTWMVDHAAVVLGVWNGSIGGTANCLAYARTRGKPIVLVDLPGEVWGQARDYELLHAPAVPSRQLTVTEQTTPPLGGPVFRRRAPPGLRLPPEALAAPPPAETLPAAVDTSWVGIDLASEPDRTAVQVFRKVPKPPEPPDNFNPGRIIDLDD